MGDVLWAMRALIARPHGFTPFRLVYKQEAVFPSYMAQYDCPPTDAVNDVVSEQQMVDELERIW